MSTHNDDVCLEAMLLCYKIDKLEGTEKGFLAECKKIGLDDITSGILILCENRRQMIALMDGMGISDLDLNKLIAYRKDMSRQAYLKAYGPGVYFEKPQATCNKKICIEGLTCDEKKLKD